MKRFSRALGKLALVTMAAVLLPAPAIFAQGYGIGGYDLASTADQIVAFDYDSSGKADHLLLYRPGTGIVWILANNNGSFSPVFASSSGIGGYDLKSPNDRIFALDYNSTGHMDHLVCYRPGAGVIYILANNGGAFYPVVTSTTGMGGFDLMTTSDIGFAYDANGGGHYDSLVFYRPGTHVVYVLANQVAFSNGFVPTFISGYGGGGLGSFDLGSPADRLVPFDIPPDNDARYLIGYRPGQQVASFIAGAASSFSSEYLSTSGIGDYDLKSPDDQIVPFDYSDTGMMDHLLAYRPGSGIAWILQYVGPVASPTFFAPIYGSGSGIGGYDLQSTTDRIIAYDYNSTGHQDHLVLYRPGTGVVWILANVNGTFQPVYAGSYLPPGYGMAEPQ